MKNKVIINKYLKELGIDFEIKTLEDITKLIQKHEEKLSFSSVKVLLKDEISLELKDIFESLVINKRGGYCFEHNKLMYEALKELGFDVQFFLARVVNNSNNEVPQTHRFTMLNFKGNKYLVDVGVGFRSPTVPVKFGNVTTNGNLGISYRIKEYKELRKYGLELIQDNKSFIVTEFNLNPCYEVDFELGHFYSHKHKDAVFLNNLVVSSILKDEIRSLRNSDYFKISKDKKEIIKVDNLGEFSRILKEDMNLILSKEEISYLFKSFIE